MKIWTTKDGKEIPYLKLEDSHLLNILKYIKRIAKELDGEVIGGGGFDADDIWYEIGEEKDWLEKYDYYGLQKEAKRRKLIYPPVN